MDWQRVIGRIASEVEDRVDRAKAELGRRIGEPRPVRIVPYRGYGRPDRARIRGRVLRGEGPGPATPEDRWWVNLSNALRRLGSDEVPHAEVRVTFGGSVAEATADEEGHFVVELSPEHPPAEGRYWHEATVELDHPDAVEGAAAAPIAISDTPRFGVISDLDDTVLRTNAASMIQVAREVLFGNVHTRIPFAGVGAFYSALHHGENGVRNPIFYVSSSPWNLYDLLAEFLRLHEIPAGPIELRDWGITPSEVLPTGHAGHKRDAIDRILDTFPGTPFVLIGDSGQEDPEIYRDVAGKWPGRVLVAYIRSVHTGSARASELVRIAEETAGHGIEMVAVDDTREAAAHAEGMGLIDAGTAERVDRARDREIQEADE